MTERAFPVLYGHARIHAVAGYPMTVPWRLLAPHEAQAQKNHGQTLERLNERGGLSLCEIVAVVEDRRWHRMDHDAARDRVNQLVLALEQSGGAATEHEPR